MQYPQQQQQMQVAFNPQALVQQSMDRSSLAIFEHLPDFYVRQAKKQWWMVYIYLVIILYIHNTRMIILNIHIQLVAVLIVVSYFRAFYFCSSYEILIICFYNHSIF